MDSQEQYEALLKSWGFEDNSIEKQARAQKRKQVIRNVFTKAHQLVRFLGDKVTKHSNERHIPQANH